jgi:hypothetical protein
VREYRLEVAYQDVVELHSYWMQVSKVTLNLAISVLCVLIDTRLDLGNEMGDMEGIDEDHLFHCAEERAAIVHESDCLRSFWNRKTSSQNWVGEGSTTSPWASTVDLGESEGLGSGA